MLGWLEWRWLRGIYSPQPPKKHWGWGASGRCLVRQPRHPTVRVRAQSTVGASSSSGTGQSGAALDRYCSLSGAPLTTALTSARTVLHCSRSLRLLQSTVARRSRCSAGAPDNLVNYSGACPEKPEAHEFGVVQSWCTGHCSVAHQIVRCARPGHPWFLCSFDFEP
jgi:hypothetical protein